MLPRELIRGGGSSSYRNDTLTGCSFLWTTSHSISYVIKGVFFPKTLTLVFTQYFQNVSPPGHPKKLAFMSKPPVLEEFGTDLKKFTEPRTKSKLPLTFVMNSLQLKMP